MIASHPPKITPCSTRTRTPTRVSRGGWPTMYSIGIRRGAKFRRPKPARGIAQINANGSLRNGRIAFVREPARQRVLRPMASITRSARNSSARSPPSILHVILPSLANLRAKWFATLAPKIARTFANAPLAAADALPETGEFARGCGVRWQSAASIGRRGGTPIGHSRKAVSRREPFVQAARKQAVERTHAAGQHDVNMASLWNPRRGPVCSGALSRSSR